MIKKRALGRGLDILIPQSETAVYEGGDLVYCDIDMMKPNPYQPRRLFTEKELEGLAESIKASGVLQPVVVRKAETGYELIVGERRWRASRLAGLKQIPAVVKEASPAEMLELALVENIHREDLNPLEKADAYDRLMKEFELTQEQVAKRVGQDRSTVANFLRLRTLPKEIRDDIINHTLSMGHARAILGAKNLAQQKAVWRRIVAGKLSVRETEALVKRLASEENRTKKKKSPTSEALYFQDLAEELSRVLGTKVSIIRKGKSGKVEIAFYNNQDLDRLITCLRRPVS